MLRTDRGLWPLVDLALLIRAAGAALDWDAALRSVQGTWGVMALRLSGDVLAAWALPAPPQEVRRWLRAHDRHGSQARHLMLRAIATRRLLEPLRPPGPLTDSRVRRSWALLARGAAP